MTLNEVAHIVGQETVNSWILNVLVDDSYMEEVITDFCEEHDLDPDRDFPNAEWAKIVEAYHYIINACADETDCEYQDENGKWDIEALGYDPTEYDRSYEIIENWYTP